MKHWLFGVSLMCVAIAAGQTSSTGLGSVPQCAQTCLSNSTNAQTACSDLDIRCLCTNQEYVNTLSCCLATQCDSTDQSKAIAFNQLECESVNETAPGFVGCSPFALSSFVILGGSASTAPVSTIPSITQLTTTTNNAANPLITTVSGSTESDFGWATVRASNPITATYAGSPILKGICATPMMAFATDVLGLSYLYPEIGCSPDRQDCCPFDAHEYALLSVCPADYTTTGTACCPSGFSVFSTNVGYVTPCYTTPSYTLLPATTPTVSGSLVLFTDIIFSRKFLLSKPKKDTSKAAITGTAVGACLCLFFFFGFILFWFRRRNQKRVALEKQKPRAGEVREPEMLDISQRPHELASPQTVPVMPASARGNWPMVAPGSFPPSYQVGGRPQSTKPEMPQELPGSTYHYQHHPAFSTRDGVSKPGTSTTPGSPPKTPTKSSMVSPRSAALDETSPVPTVSPLTSPKIV